MSDLSSARKNHNLILENRASLTLSGVTKVGSFEETQAVFYTDWGEVTVTGSDLHVGKLSVETGDVEVTGKIRSVSYRDGGPANEPFFKRLFK